MKRLDENSKEVVYNSIHKKTEQVNSFILYIGKTQTSVGDIKGQIKKVFKQEGTDFVNEVVFVDESIIEIYKRKK